MMKCFSLYYEAEAQDGRVDVEVRNSASWLRFLETMLERNAISTAETKRTLGIRVGTRSR
jgi:hypothetical protein